MSFPSIAIDEEGFPLINEIRVSDSAVGAQILSTLRFNENKAFIADVGTATVIVEAFDEPLIVQMVEEPSNEGDDWTAQLLYQVTAPFNLDSLSIDEWDRFHGVTKSGVPFVFSRKAQAAFFDLMDEFDDDSITFEEKQYTLPPWLSSNPEIRTDKFWSNIYTTETPGWELNAPSPVLKDMLPRIKLPKSRVLVLGCGSGNDAAFFAEQGHFVMAVDFSHEAIALAQKKYGHLTNLKFVQNDVFKLDRSWEQSFDFIFEHTLYCAIPPERRTEYIHVWRKMLAPTGQIMAVFFVMEKRVGPPFGGSEWEIRERLKKYFQFHFWGRWKDSVPGRVGKELFVLGTKLSPE